MSLLKPGVSVEKEDDYWNNSSVSALSFNDEIVSQSVASKSDSDLDFNSKNDEIETVDWSGNKVVFSNSPSPSRAPIPVFSKTTLSLTSATKMLNAGAFNSSVNLTPSISSIKSTTSGGSIDDAASKASHSDFSRLKSEHAKLQKEFEHLRQGRYAMEAPDLMIDRFMKGGIVVFTMYKQLAHKIQLLDKAIASLDADAILMVLLFLESTLSEALFLKQLLDRPIAADHFVTHLKQRFKFEKAVQILLSLGRKEEAVLLEFKQANMSSNPEVKVENLKKSLQGTLGCTPALNSEACIVTEYISLLERQIPIDSSDNKSISVGREELFKLLPKNCSLIDQPVLTTLYYCSLYHYELPQNSFASPLSMKLHHKLSDKQFCWQAAKALCRKKKWQQLEVLLTSKSMMGLGSSKIRFPLPAVMFLEIMHKHQSSVETMAKFISSIQDIDERLRMAIQFKCEKLAVECYVNCRDRIGLEQYVRTLTSHTTQKLFAEGALKNSNTKWKN